MRCFIALEIPQSIKDSLQSLQETLKASQADVRWVKPESMHLTLRFLGNIEDTQVEQVKSLLDAVAQDHSVFTLGVKGVGAFPDTQSPKVVWAGLDKGKDKLIQLTKALCSHSKAQDLPPEDNPFSPHITLGRVRSRKFRQMLTNALESSAWNCPDSWQVDSIKLYRSELTQEGPVYSVLHTVALG